MQLVPLARRLVRPLAPYALALLLCGLLLTWVMKLWRADLSIPFNYGGDGLVVLLWAKGIHEHGWFLHNDAVGAPWGQDLRDYPLADNLHFLLMKLLCAAVSDPVRAVNLQYLLTFPLTTVCTLAVLRRFGVSTAPALVGSLLYTFVPYHFFRGSCHLFLASYFLIPLMVMVILWLYLDVPLFFRRDEVTGTWRWHLRDRRSLGSLVICALLSAAGVYYAFFACYFLLVAGTACSCYRKHLYPLGVAVLLTAVLGTGVVANVSPCLVYRYQQGANAEALDRRGEHAEVFGLKIIQLLLPITGHRVPWLADLKARYNSVPELLVNENDFASLGFIGSMGFLLLLGRLLWRNRTAERGLPDGLTLLNGAAVLLGTMGGLGCLVSLLAFPWIRCYNRLSIYIALFSFFLVVLLLDRAYRRFGQSLGRRTAFVGLLGLFLAAGMLDQTGKGPAFKPPFSRVKEQYRQQEQFIQRVEASLPEGALVFQLPYLSFPEHPLVEGMGPYEQFRGYLHSRTLRWSYGTMKGREGDVWQRTMAGKDPDEFVRLLAYVGFDGIYVDRAFFADGAAQVEKQLAGVLDSQPVVDATRRCAFFNMTNYKQALRRGLTDEEWAARRDEALHPVVATWEKGFASLEMEAGKRWRWCASTGELCLTNGTAHDKTVTLELCCATAEKQLSGLWIDGPLFTAQLQVNEAGCRLARTVTVPPGKHSIRFLCGANRVYAPSDPRTLVFKMTGFALRELNEERVAD